MLANQVIRVQYRRFLHSRDVTSYLAATILKVLYNQSQPQFDNTKNDTFKNINETSSTNIAISGFRFNSEKTPDSYIHIQNHFLTYYASSTKYIIKTNYFGFS
jgi:hypothetical protein